MESIHKLKPDFYREISNEAIGLKGYVVIDKQINGAATGGIRMAPNVSIDEIASLAHEMTLKYAIFKVKKDGAKAGIISSDSESQESKKKLCNAFGKEIGDLVREGKYFPGQDLGINSCDLEEILAGAGIDACNRSSTIDSAYCTALTVYLSIREVLFHSKMNIKETTFIIEGFGKVGEQLAKMISNDGARIYGISTACGAIFDPNGINIDKACELKKEYGDNLVSFYDKDKEIKKEDLILKQADVVVPGARPDSINENNISKLKCRIIVPIANIAATEAIEHRIFDQGIIFVPGFVSNAGGILGYYFEEQGFDSKTVNQIINNGFPNIVKKLIAQSHESKKSISSASRVQASENIKKIAKSSALPTLKKFSPKMILWMIYKNLAVIKAGFLLRNFAVNYITSKHFE